MATILVTGGAGFIGSHTTRRLREAGHDVVVIDNLSAGHRSALDPDVPLVVADLSDSAAVAAAFAEHRPDAAIHFAGSIEAGESMTDPRRFYRNNVVTSLNLLNVAVDVAAAAGAVPLPMVFSSSAAVYGDPVKTPIEEGDPKQPTNVYGRTKLDVEGICEAYSHAYGLRSISLRYFNACGADRRGDIGADHKNKTHLITLAMLAALGKRPSIKVFGTDYDTVDGTCIRDYIHVDDLAVAHVLAIEALLDGADTTAYNVGVGKGFTVTEVLDSVDRVTGGTLVREYAERRAGDPVALVADSTLISRELGWSPRYTDIDPMCATAWEWHRTHPDGFAD